MKKNKLLISLFITASLTFGASLYAQSANDSANNHSPGEALNKSPNESLNNSPNSESNETTLEKAEDVKNKATDNANKNRRDLENKVCETINGKLECFPKKVKNNSKNLIDDVESDSSRIKNKIDD